MEADERGRMKAAVRTNEPARYNGRPAMPFLELATGSTLGAVLGMRHALEPDHLAAVSTLVADERKSTRALLLGVCWGVGHTIALVAVGVVLIVLRAQLSARLTDLFELGV